MNVMSKPLFIIIFLMSLALFFISIVLRGGSTEQVRWVKEGRFTEQGQTYVAEAAQHSEQNKLSPLLQNNPHLVSYLYQQSQSIALNQGNGSSQDINYFNRVVSTLNHLLQAQYSNQVRQHIYGLDRNAHKLRNYLSAYISLQKRAGRGFVSNVDADVQINVFEALKLTLTLNDLLSSDQKLSEVAAWYSQEESAKTPSQVFRQQLLQFAWALSLEKMKADGVDGISEHEVKLRHDTDFTRLLNHPNRNVARNSAHLISVFAPDNATTALKFQLVRSKNNSERFQLLDALKLYGEKRGQIEPQLKSMMLLTRDTQLQAKLAETIDHLNGRISELN